MAVEPLKILVVDDSRIYRGLVETSLAGLENCQVVGSVMNGQKALDFLRTTSVDLVLLDTAMPDMDGFQALRRMNEAQMLAAGGSARGVILLVDPSHAADARVLESMTQGVFEVFLKKGTTDDEIQEALAKVLLPRVRAFGHRTLAGEQMPQRKAGVRVETALGCANTDPPGERFSAKAILVAASTGGPKALDEVLPAMCHSTDLPILIVQHMPGGFTGPMAKHLSARCGIPVLEGKNGECVRPRHVYVAPGGRHMMVRQVNGGDVELEVNEAPPFKGLRPCADVMFRSAHAVWGGAVIAVILTGMGDDGTEGVRDLRQAGAYVIAQDEATSVVWGMPGSIVAAGLHHQILALADIPSALRRLVGS